MDTADRVTAQLDALRPMMRRMTDAVLSAPLDDEERFELALYVACNALGAACAAYDVTQSSSARPPRTEVVRLVCGILATMAERRHRTEAPQPIISDIEFDR